MAVSLVAVLGLAIGHAPPALTQLEGGGGRPNVLIFMTDDQRDNLEVMDAVKRELLRNGRDYPNAYVTTPSCCPSRASVMTGRYAHNHGVATNSMGEKLDHRTTVQFHLERAGYQTGYVGKFLNAWPITEGPPFFDDWAITAPYRNKKEAYYGGKVNVNGGVRRLEQYTTNFFGDQAASFLRRANRSQDARPWLLYVAPNAPHPPFQTARKYARAPVPKWDGSPALRERDRSDKPRWVQNQHVSDKKGRRIRRVQLRMLMSVDDMVAQVLATVRTLKERNTLVIFTSDNGYAWGDHGLEKKFSPYRESVRVPLLLRWPDHIPPSSQDTRLVANIDIAPTIYEATGIEPDGPPVDGRSLLDPTWQRQRLLLEYGKHPYFPSPNWASTVTQTSQYVESYRKGRIIFREYYENDAFQLRNLLGDEDRLNNPPTVRAMHLLLEQDKECAGATCP